ncbi:MAG: hypothetical protein H0U50_05330 [Pyrinomonadaceae bacterium]|nr:hypothetical protein [Pyrinomonadaceae bacterium]
MKTKKTWKIFEVRVSKTNFSDKINSPVSSRDNVCARDDADELWWRKISLFLYLQHIEKVFASRTEKVLC